MLLADWTSLHLDVVAHDRGLKRLAASLVRPRAHDIATALRHSGGTPVARSRGLSHPSTENSGIYAASRDGRGVTLAVRTVLWRSRLERGKSVKIRSILLATCLLAVALMVRVTGAWTTRRHHTNAGAARPAAEGHGAGHLRRRRPATPGTDTCVTCHEPEEKSLKGTKHGQAKNPRAPCGDPRAARAVTAPARRTSTTTPRATSRRWAR